MELENIYDNNQFNEREAKLKLTLLELYVIIAIGKLSLSKVCGTNNLLLSQNLDLQRQNIN